MIDTKKPRILLYYFLFAAYCDLFQSKQYVDETTKEEKIKQEAHEIAELLRESEANIGLVKANLNKAQSISIEENPELLPQLTAFYLYHKRYLQFAELYYKNEQISKKELDVYDITVKQFKVLPRPTNSKFD